jgi:hypothetical protein
MITGIHIQKALIGFGDRYMHTYTLCVTHRAEDNKGR